MDYDRLLTIVEQDLGIGRERAERAVRATLQTRSERSSAGQAREHARAVLVTCARRSAIRSSPT